MSQRNHSTGSSRQTRFPSTRWTLVIQAQGKNPEEARRALTELCRRYWKPVFVFLRKNERSESDAEDLTQSFFERVLREGILTRAKAERGRLRTFLLVNLKRHLTAERLRAGAQKRGGAFPHQSFEVLAQDVGELEGLVDDKGSFEEVFDRAWAHEVFETVLNRLEERYRKSGSGLLFGHLRNSLSDGRIDSYAELAKKTGINEGALRTRVSRMRKAIRKGLEEEIADTVESPAEIKDEMRYLALLLHR